jgi:hypothetical protein
MRALLSVTLAAALVAISGQQAAWAQSFGSRSAGGSITSGRSSGGASFGSRSGGAPTGFTSEGVGEAQGNERFVRGNRQAGDFVGGAAPDSGSGGFIGSQASGANTGGSRSTRNRGSSSSGSANQPNRSSSRSSRNDVRARIRLGFTIVRPTATSILPRLHHHLDKISLPQSSSPIQVEIEKGTATLRGAVASAHDRAIAERLALLEGGIWKVNNELTVVGVQTPPAPK